MNLSVDDFEKRIEENEERSKTESLRSTDIVPPFGGSVKDRIEEETALSGQAAGEKKSKPVSIPIEEFTAGMDADAARPSKAEMLRFDLTDKIMAKDRKITAARRQGPGQKGEAAEEKQPIESDVVRDTPSEQDRIIVEIVAQDIERLSRGEF